MRKHQLAHGLGNVFGVNAHGVRSGPEFELLLFRRLRLRARNEAVLQHAINDVLLPGTGPFRVTDRVVGARRLWQTGKHCGFRDRDFLERLVEIGFTGGRESVGSLSQENLVHIDLKNLVLGQQVLQLEGQENLVNLAGVGFFGREIHVARHLHCDGGGALAFEIAQVGQGGTQHAFVVHPAVFVEPCVFNCQNGIGHHFRNVFEARQVAALLPKLANQDAFRGKYAQRQDRTVIRQVRNIGQIRERYGQGNRHNHGDRQCAGQRQAKHPVNGAQDYRRWAWASARRFWHVGGSVGCWISMHRIFVRSRHHYKNAWPIKTGRASIALLMVSPALSD